MALFALTIFAGAFLLFQVQPLMGKFILPWFGGGPAVWTACVLFFQLLLLGGYSYAHLSTRWFRPRGQALLHAVLLLAAVALLPITPSAAWKPDSVADPVWHIMKLLTACLGVPYFVLAATGPLLQAWLSRCQPDASPYRLYALSNLGSLLALLSFPFLFEPLLSRLQQAAMWAWGLRIFAVLGCIRAFRFWQRNPAAAPRVVNTENRSDAGPRTTALTQALWLAWPASAATLLLAVTNRICQDVAVVPFLWVLPLALYLASFILCFGSPYWYWRRYYHGALMLVLGAVGLLLFEGMEMPLLVQVGICTVALFVCCMVCHGELYRLKPPPRWLTSYYLMLAAGGALGGIFVVVAAPLVFNAYRELEVGLWGCAVLLLITYAREKSAVPMGERSIPAWKPAALGVIALGFLLVWQAQRTRRDTLLCARNFYSVLRVYEHHRDLPAERANVLRVGEIVHGLQLLQPARSRVPTGYYHERSGVGLALSQIQPQAHRRIGVVGLGIGTLAAYGRDGDDFCFYEINPAVPNVAGKYFTFLKESPAKVEVVMGDARLSLEKEPPRQFDLLALDAFSSDAIPVHLLTKEAFAVYLRHLKAEGVIAVHISNQHLDLRPVVRNLAAHFRLHAALISFKAAPHPWWWYPADWVLLTKNRELLDCVPIRQATNAPEEDGPRGRLWTDDYASLLTLLK
jgi:hypothetical protein